MTTELKKSALAKATRAKLPPEALSSAVERSSMNAAQLSALRDCRKTGVTAVDLLAAAGNYKCRRATFSRSNDLLHPGD